MTLDDAIEHAEQMAELAKWGPLEDEYQQQLDWLKELKRLRAVRAVQDIALANMRAANLENERLKAKNDKLKSENARFRDLCIDMWHAIPQSESCGWDSDANCCSGYEDCNCECAYWYRMHELGIKRSDLGDEE